MCGFAAAAVFVGSVVKSVEMSINVQSKFTLNLKYTQY